jgi:hypothetical protein
MSSAANPALNTREDPFCFHSLPHTPTRTMSSNDYLDDSEQLRAFEASMTAELGWVASQIEPVQRAEGVEDSMESREGHIIDPFAAHDARTCSCKSLARIQASLKKTAAENGFVLKPDQLEEHAIKIDADYRKTHLFRDGQTGAQISGSNTYSSRRQRGECHLQLTSSTSSDLSGMTLPHLAHAPPNRQTAGMLPAPSATNSSSGRRSNSGALPSTAPSSKQYAYNPSMPGSRADRRPRG